MRLVYLYGPPGVGKLTVARELVALTGFKLLHNHLTVNLVTSVFPFGSAEFTRLIRRFRREMLVEAAQAGIDLIMTGVHPGTSEFLEAIQRMIEPVLTAGGSVLFVQLTCDRDVWLARIPNESRRIEHKLLDPEQAVGLFGGQNPFTAIPIEPSLRIDTTQIAPAEAALQIVTRFGLPRVDAGQPQAT